MTRLWETSHPYYCNEGNYYARPDEGLHEEYDSWAEFYEAWGYSDEDMNLVFRWDWQVPDPNDYEPGEQIPSERLAVFWVLQRKAILRSTECVVTRDDEPAIREWLTKRAKTVAAIWAPLLTEASRD
ncbi:hypothetical protein [Micromonospora sp. NPDC005652]|uniref:hypothetical protein n=1 Tax=Micromonospora sp. NPDC005652 TaxID=3157046 RepID=UPI0033F04D84